LRVIDERIVEKAFDVGEGHAGEEVAFGWNWRGNGFVLQGRVGSG
jgi:hypothetical protein